MTKVQINWKKSTFVKELLLFICVSVWVHVWECCAHERQERTSDPLGACYMQLWVLLHGELNSRPQWEKATTVLDHWAIFPTQKQTFLSELTDLGQVTNLSVNGGKTQWPTSLKIQTVSFCFPNNKHWLQCWKVTCHQLSRWPTGKLHPVTPRTPGRKRHFVCRE